MFCYITFGASLSSKNIQRQTNCLVTLLPVKTASGQIAQSRPSSLTEWGNGVSIVKLVYVDYDLDLFGSFWKLVLVWLYVMILGLTPIAIRGAQDRRNVKHKAKAIW